MIGLFRTLLIIFIIYYLFKLVVRILFPLFIKIVINNMQHDASRRDPNRMAPKPEGEISIEQKESQKSGRKNDTDDGDYVDYEEIK